MQNKKQITKNKSLPLKQNRSYYWWLAAILILTYFTLSPSLKNGFTNWDDNIYIGENPFIKSVSAENIKAIFKTENFVSLNYHPLTILSLAYNYKQSGFNPYAYHLTNLLLHLLNTILVFWFIFLLSHRKIIVANIVALFFGIHPMHVESVAWVAERKDVLYTFFFLASLIFYYKYITSENKNKIISYIFCLLLFLFSCLSKAVAVVLPLVLFLIDYYTNRKITKKSLLEKIPFIAVSIYYGMLAVSIQSHGAIAKFEIFTVFQRFAFASYGLLCYVYNLFLPIKLSCYYPYPILTNASLPAIFYVAPILVLVLFTLVAITLRKTKIIVFGFLFFFTTIVLVLQFISVGQVIMADRYSYVPYIGLLFIIAMGFDWFQQQTVSKYKSAKQISFVLISISAVLCMWLSYERTQVWKNGETLWTDAISKYPNSEPYRNRGSYLVNKSAYDLGQKNIGENEYDRALEDFNISIKMNATNAKVFTNRANIYGLKGKFDLALQDYNTAIELDKTDEQAYFNRGVTYGFMKQLNNAVESYSSALKLLPDFPKAKFNRAFAYINIEKYQEAITDLNDLISKENANSDYYFYRGFAYLKLGDYNAALQDHNSAIALNQKNGNLFFNRSTIYKALGKNSDALQDALTAKSLGYEVDESYINELKNYK